jgi:hypothetical protein
MLVGIGKDRTMLLHRQSMLLHRQSERWHVMVRVVLSVSETERILPFEASLSSNPLNAERMV